MQCFFAMKSAKVFSWLGLFMIVVLVYLLSAKAVAADAQIVLIREDQNSADTLERSTDVSLLNWTMTSEFRQKPATTYNRQKQFGRWIQFKKTKGCYDTRAQVLIRDSRIEATSTDNKPCTIEKGEWLDPYSGRQLYDDDQVQIDHMVPLKEAYLAGASQWSQAQRCVYANFMGMKEHLVATSNFENLSKSDKTPELYMPPSREYKCAYLKNWLTVKLIWKLTMTSNEAQAIRARMKDAGCDEKEFIVSQTKISEVRQVAKNLEATCPVPRNPK